MQDTKAKRVGRKDTVTESSSRLRNLTCQAAKDISCRSKIIRSARSSVFSDLAISSVSGYLKDCRNVVLLPSIRQDGKIRG